MIVICKREHKVAQDPPLLSANIKHLMNGP